MDNKKDQSLAAIELLKLAQEVSSNDLDVILNTINNQTIALLNADRCTLYVYDPIKDELSSKIAKGLEIDEIRLKVGFGIAGYVAQTKEILSIDDVYNNKHFAPHIDELTGYNTKSLLAGPLLSINQNLVGVIQVLNKRGGLFTEKDKELFQILSKISAIAIEQAQLYEWNNVLRQYNESIIKDIYSGLIVIDTDYHVMVVNKIAETIFAPLITRLKGKNLLTELAFIPEFSGFLKKLVEQGDAKLDRVETIQDGICFYLNFRGSRLKSDTPSDYGYVLLVDDITSKVFLERGSKQKEQLVLIGNMTSSIIHDIKNPMSIIKGYLQVMSRRVKDEKFHEYFSIVDREINRLVAMTEEVLNFARGEYNINLETSDVIDFIYEVTPLIKQLFSEKQIQLKIRIQFKGEVLFDKDKMQRLFYNIASNANDAMSRGGKFEIKIYRDANMVNFHFIDDGEGISEDIQKKLFVPFTSYGKSHGIGLGMAIVKKIIDEHNGKIEVKSSQDTGTEIIVSLPLIGI